MAGTFLLTRRSFLIGCSAAASPLLTPVTFAAAPGENRLVTIVLRGAMDGLDLVRAAGDAGLAGLRPTLYDAAAERLDLDGFFALHPAASALMPLWQAGELGFVHAVATPYRQGRSHFIGQDALENGTPDEHGDMTPARDGWLNRAVGLIPGARPDMAVSVGQERLLLLDGRVPTAHWLPVAASGLSGQGRALLEALYREDGRFEAAYGEAQALMEGSNDPRAPRGDPGHAELGGYVAAQLVAEARIAGFSLPGWDTHQNQARLIEPRIAGLAETMLALKAGLGAAWATTLVMAMTEFGRTARENGSAGTDHGTGGVMILAGGALKGRRVLGRWPGLDEGDLLNGRDLMPTADVRGHAAWALRAMFGLDRAALETTVFPGLDMGADPGLLL